MIKNIEFQFDFILLSHCGDLWRESDEKPEAVLGERSARRPGAPAVDGRAGRGGARGEQSGGPKRRRRVRRNRIEAPPNFERLVLGCIDADFCKSIVNY